MKNISSLKISSWKLKLVVVSFQLQIFIWMVWQTSTTRSKQLNHINRILRKIALNRYLVCHIPQLIKNKSSNSSISKMSLQEFQHLEGTTILIIILWGIKFYSILPNKIKVVLFSALTSTLLWKNFKLLYKKSNKQRVDFKWVTLLAIDRVSWSQKARDTPESHTLAVRHHFLDLKLTCRIILTEINRILRTPIVCRLKYRLLKNNRK
jgi:hypothetical protein